MNCPSCNRILASTLSVCPSCGTMIHDSVREELALKISPRTNAANAVSENLQSPLVNPPSNSAKAPQTSEIMIKNTSPTLVDFQNRNSALPDWRLQLQNSVRKRLDEQQSSSENETEAAAVVVPKARLVTKGATALKAEPSVQSAPRANPTIENALKRIERSRLKYLAPETPRPVERAKTVMQFPAQVSHRILERAETEASGEETFSPAANGNVAIFPNEPKTEKYDTNKLSPLPEPAKISSSFERKSVAPRKIELTEDEILDSIHVTNRGADIHKTAEANLETFERDDEGEEYYDEADDFAPVSLRFNAALFDLLITSFTSLILLSPFMILNGRFFSTEGFFAFLATCAIVTFIYFTATIGFLGRTFGMKLFSLEILDVEVNDYPTLHQAAVNSSVYLLSLALGGIGFLPMLLNSERRAAHDLLSRTIVIKEYQN